MPKKVPILITSDVHLHVFPIEEIERSLQNMIGVLKGFGIKTTFFFPANAASIFKDTVKSIIEAGHLIGCHGLTHEAHEQYNCLPQDMQEDYIRRATDQICEVTGEAVNVFRAPVFKISGATVRVLERCGYKADFSINSQRLGLSGSDIFNISWMYAPRMPYHPDRCHPCRKGKTKLWEIPLSCLLLPFMSNTGQMFKLSFMKRFFDFLYYESKLTGKPIVYLVHAEDLFPMRKDPGRKRIRLRDLLPSRTYGFECRHWFFQTNPQKVYEQNIGLFKYMSSFEDVQFLRADEYISLLEGL